MLHFFGLFVKKLYRQRQYRCAFCIGVGNEAFLRDKAFLTHFAASWLEVQTFRQATQNESHAWMNFHSSALLLKHFVTHTVSKNNESSFPFYKVEDNVCNSSIEYSFRKEQCDRWYQILQDLISENSTLFSGTSVRRRMALSRSISPLQYSIICFSCISNFQQG